MNLLDAVNSGSGVEVDFNNPFTKTSLVSVVMWVKREVFTGKENVVFKSDIIFRNGGTRAEQNITANNFPELLLKVNSFISKLP